MRKSTTRSPPPRARTPIFTPSRVRVRSPTTPRVSQTPPRARSLAFHRLRVQISHPARRVTPIRNPRTLLVLNLRLDVIDRVRGLHLERDRLPRQRFHENLHLVRARVASCGVDSSPRLTEASIRRRRSVCPIVFYVKICGAESTH